MRRSIDSLLVGGDEVEVLVVDDGSWDATAQIADEYARAYPGVVRAIHQANGGHGPRSTRAWRTRAGGTSRSSTPTTGSRRAPTPRSWTCCAPSPPVPVTWTC
nr:glycosyltransferase [Serpens gallinarum]